MSLFVNLDSLFLLLSHKPLSLGIPKECLFILGNTSFLSVDIIEESSFHLKSIHQAPKQTPAKQTNQPHTPHIFQTIVLLKGNTFQFFRNVVKTTVKNMQLL